MTSTFMFAKLYIEKWDRDVFGDRRDVLEQADHRLLLVVLRLENVPVIVDDVGPVVVDLPA